VDPRLAHHDEIAQVLLAQSTQLTDRDLVEIAGSVRITSAPYQNADAWQPR
jgi:hypothetical protein